MAWDTPITNQLPGFRLRDMAGANRITLRDILSHQVGLAYNTFPEPFGFYVLESVHNGTPVYTNGAGNNRFLLPPGHGIVVQETGEMAGTFENPPAPAAYRPLSR